MILLGSACDTCIHREDIENRRARCALYYPDKIPAEVYCATEPPPQCAANGSFERTEFWKKALGEK